jgi:chromosome segregation ATPase
VIRAAKIAPLSLALAAGLLLAAGCGKPPGGSAAPPGPPPAGDEAWTPERIAADPDGYLQYAYARIRQQVAGREQRLAQLEQRRGEIDAKSADLLQRVADAQNIHARLATAIQRAEDEDRWPLKFAGHTFSREKATAVLAATAAYQKERAPLAAAYREALDKLAATQRALRADLAGLGQMREKLALDLERVRLNRGMAELAELRQTEAKLANFSATLAGLTDDPLTAPASNVPDVDVNDLLK